MRLVPESRIHTYREQGSWGTETLDDLFRQTAAARPDDVALVDPPNRTDLTDGRPRRLTYRELDDLVGRLGGALTGLGIARGDIVMAQLPNVVELVALYLVAARFGFVLSPLPVQFREYEIGELIQFAEPKAFITASRILEHRNAAMVAKLAEESGPLQIVAAFGDGVPDGVAGLRQLDDQPTSSGAMVSADDVLTICWTSGTEGRPKGVPRSHNEWLVPAYATVDAARLRAGAHLLNPFPMVNMAGIGGMLVPWLLTQGKLVMHHPLNLPVFLQQIAVEQIHYTVAPPALLTLLLKNEQLLAKADIGSIETIGSGSAPLSPWMVTEWQERFGISIINFFGSNEGATFVSGPDTIPDPASRAEYFPRFGAPGFEWPDRVARWMRSKLVDPETEAAISEPGVPGEMRISGPSVFSGYFRDAERTTRAFDEDGYYRTGDLFEIAADEHGPRFYRFVGRAGDVINRGGMKIVPEELEQLLAAHPSLAEVAVVGYPDDVLHEKVGLVAVTREDQDIELDAIRRFLTDQGIAEFKLPDRMRLVDALPRNPVGKIRKQELRAALADG